MTDDSVNSLVENYTKIPDEVEEELQKWKITLPQIPEFDKQDSDLSFTEQGEPIFPADVTNYTLDKLGKLYNICVIYLNYLDNCLAFANMNANVYKERRDLVWSEKRKELDGTKDDKNDYAKTCGSYSRANSEFTTKQEVSNIIKKKLAQFERTSTFLSREISRRQLEIQHEKNQLQAEKNLNFIK